MVQSNGGVSKSTNDFLDSDDGDDIELIVVRPKSKSRVPRPLSPLSYEKHDGIEFITKQLGTETQMALTSKTGYIKVLFKRSLVSNGWTFLCHVLIHVNYETIDKELSFGNILVPNFFVSFLITFNQHSP